MLLKSQKLFNPDLIFPVHKIQVTKGIEWIATANSLIKEGVEMEHCIGTYVASALSGKSIIFAIYEPERATLEIRNRKGSFVRSEIKLKRNKIVSNRTLEFINNWLLKENNRINRQ